VCVCVRERARDRERIRVCECMCDEDLEVVCCDDVVLLSLEVNAMRC